MRNVEARPWRPASATTGIEYVGSAWAIDSRVGSCTRVASTSRANVAVQTIM